LSRKHGEKIEQLTEDHKPSQKGEEIRILGAGGKVYQ
jgi:serine/threonine protein phosphatase PrpC